MRLRSLRFTILGPILALMLMLMSGNAGAASGPQARLNLKNFGATPRHSVIQIHKVSALNTSSSGTHYLYVDDGANPDSIDVYKTGTTLTHVGNYPTGGGVSTAYYGSSIIAVTKGCLVYGDQANGFIDTFPIASNGSLGTEVGHVAAAAGAVPADIHINSAGNTAYVIEVVNGSTSNLYSYSIGTGCTLKAEKSASATTQLYLTFALVGSNLVTVDLNTGNIDSYKLGKGGTITLLKSVPGQITSGADSVAVQFNTKTKVYSVYTGQATTSAPEVQGGKYTTKTGAISFFKGSPATDPSGSNGASVYFDNKHGVLIQGEQYTDTLATYTVKSGTLAFKSETTMAVSGESPSTMVSLGTTLFVDMVYNGDVEACTLTSTGPTGCKTVATLTSNAGVEAGIAIL